MEPYVVKVARLLYNAYGNSAGWKTFSGDKMLSFSDLPPEIHDHWVNVAYEAADIFEAEV